MKFAFKYVIYLLDQYEILVQAMCNLKYIFFTIYSNICFNFFFFLTIYFKSILHMTWLVPSCISNVQCNKYNKYIYMICRRKTLKKVILTKKQCLCYTRSVYNIWRGTVNTISNRKNHDLLNNTHFKVSISWFWFKGAAMTNYCSVFLGNLNSKREESTV